MFPAPQSERELLQRAQALAGLTLAEVAQQCQTMIPDNLLREKGWAGQLLELVLGAHSGSKPQPDFVELGIELKTLPISWQGKPLETTFVCVAPLTGQVGLTWHNSGVYQKLKRVLWVPILAEREIAIADRIIGTPFIWSPTAEQASWLQQDWEELMELISLGRVDEINGSFGQYLQLRPKAANSKALTDAIGANGERVQVLPRGFYLKIPFTTALLQHQFASQA